jgi:MMPL family
LTRHPAIVAPPATALWAIALAGIAGSGISATVAMTTERTTEPGWQAALAAAVVMVGVFAVFATLQFLFFKQFGVGLAAAVLIDATIIRGVLLPASMTLLGERNWYLPRWLRWLPRPPAEALPEPTATARGLS